MQPGMRSFRPPSPLHAQVEALLDRLRPALVADGGNVELVAVDEDGTVRLALGGACVTCPAQLATLRLALEPALRAELPAVKAIIAV
jgi:Fe-S cluster biogenesis protein NfuA